MGRDDDSDDDDQSGKASSRRRRPASATIMADGPWLAVLRKGVGAEVYDESELVMAKRGKTAKTRWLRDEEGSKDPLAYLCSLRFARIW